MIALRRKLERAVRHPLFGPVCLLLLAILLVFTALHGAHDQLHEGELVVCIVLAIGGLVSPAIARPSPLSIRQRPARDPPLKQARALLASAFTPPLAPTPLRR